LWITPDGVYTETAKTSAAPIHWGITWPLLTNDGQALATSIGKTFASTGFARGGDQESFLSVDQQATIETDVPTMRSTYGDLLALRVVSSGAINSSFIYPHNSGQPPADEVQRSMRRTRSGFTSILGGVEDNIYVGRTVAGGEGRELRLSARAKPALTFDQRCGFLTQIREGRVVSVETDRDVKAHFGKAKLSLEAHRLRTLP
jgi:hypothetical protein